MIQIGIKSRYKFISVHPETGKETELSGWSDNVVLTNGRNKLADFNWFTACQVGTDNTLPDAGQGGLQGYVAGTTTIEEDVTGLEATYGWRRKRFRFGVGEAAGNLNEVGIGWSVTDGDLVTRSLTEDINGNQNTITPKVDEYLDVLAEVRYYWPSVDVTGTKVVNSVTYDYTVRASQTNVLGAWANSIGEKIESYAIGNSDWSFYDGNIALAGSPPNGIGYPSDNSNDFTNAYSSGSYEITFGMNVSGGVDGVDAWNANTGNLARTLVFKTTAGWYQIEFDSQSVPGQGIPKTSSFTMGIDFTLGWAEQAIP